MTARRPRRRLALIVAGVVVAVDALSKAIAAHYLAGRGVVNLFGGHFHLELYRNHAGPGNTFAGHPVLVSLLSLAAVIVIAAVLLAVRSRSTAIALGLLLGGGVGNLIDRFVTSPGAAARRRDRLDQADAARRQPEPRGPVDQRRVDRVDRRRRDRVVARRSLAPRRVARPVAVRVGAIAVGREPATAPSPRRSPSSPGETELSRPTGPSPRPPLPGRASRASGHGELEPGMSVTPTLRRRRRRFDR